MERPKFKQIPRIKLPYELTIKNRSNPDYLNNEKCLEVWRKIDSIVPRWYVEKIIDDAVTETWRMLDAINAKKFAFGWSSGKDSIALQAVMDRAGISDCVMCTSMLTYPEGKKWTEKYKPKNLTVIERKSLNLEYLRRNPEMLFPHNCQLAGKWIYITHRVGFDRYCRQNDVDTLILGERRFDGNFPMLLFRNKNGLATIKPIFEWTHEEVLAVYKAYGPPELAPWYYWPRGFHTGSRGWAQKRSNPIPKSQLWLELLEIDSSIVKNAAEILPVAKRVWKWYETVRS